MSSNATVVSVFVPFFVLFATVCILCTAIVQNKQIQVHQSAFENGYQEQVLPGSSMPCWVKVEAAKQ